MRIETEVLSPQQEGRQATQQALRQQKQLADKQTGPRGNARPGDQHTVLYKIFVSVIVSVCLLERVCVPTTQAGSNCVCVDSVSVLLRV